jgi:hypothetical protein
MMLEAAARQDDEDELTPDALPYPERDFDGPIGSGVPPGRRSSRRFELVYQGLVDLFCDWAFRIWLWVFVPSGEGFPPLNTQRPLPSRQFFGNHECALLRS